MAGPGGASAREHLDALIRASRAAADPGLLAAAALADTPFVQDWAASEALRALGAPRDPREPSGRLTLFALGRDAPAMARGALGVFGDAVDEGVVAVPGSLPSDPFPGLPSSVAVFGARPEDAGAAVATLARALGPRDRALVLLSPEWGWAAARPPEGAGMDVLRTLDARAAGAGWSAAARAGLRDRLNGLACGGLAARIQPARLMGLRLGGDPPGTDPLGTAVPSGRDLEIRLRAAGLPLPPGIVAALRAPDAAHPGAGRSSSGAEGIQTIRTRGAGVAGALAEARARGLDCSVLTYGFRGDPTAAGRGLARVGRALADGLGGLTLPACALAVGRLDGEGGRFDALCRAAGAALGGSAHVAVDAWALASGEPDLHAVVVVEEEDRAPAGLRCSSDPGRDRWAPGPG